MTPVDTIQFENGLSARIFHDADVEQPFSDDDAVRIVILHRRYLDPSHGECGRTPEEVAAWEEQNSGAWFTIPLFHYNHGGTLYRVGHSNPFHCPWDFGRVGIVALKCSEWGNGGEPDCKLAEYAAGVAATYTRWANGEVYGYVLHDRAGREIDSCRGFIGIESVRQGATEAAAVSPATEDSAVGAGGAA